MQVKNYYRLISLGLLLTSVAGIRAQDTPELSFFQPADTLNKQRFWTVVGAGSAAYAGSAAFLFNAWYKDYPISGFRFFDDRGEWENMDKMGHAFSAYNGALISYRTARWTGVRHGPATWAGIIGGSALQLTIEVMDGFSAGWGFSTADVAYNTIGVGIFAGQEWLWKEQRIYLKYSYNRPDYPDLTLTSRSSNQTATLAEWTNALYGSSLPVQMLKDYNGQTLWASINLASFLDPKERSGFPRWLNLAVGYGVDNVFGAYGNSWRKNGVGYSLPIAEFPRYRQLYLSVDIDWSRIKTRKWWLRALLQTANVIKIPAPTVEFNTLGQTKFYPFKH